MEVSDFVYAFNYISVNFYKEAWRSNYYEKINDDGSMKSYTFTLKIA
jgi:hypothetical protein